MFGYADKKGVSSLFIFIFIFIPHSCVCLIRYVAMKLLSLIYQRCCAANRQQARVFLKNIRLMLLLCLLVSAFSASAQVYKQEKEARIRQEEMPVSAISLLTPLLEHAKRIRYYRETDGETTGFEAKLRWEKRTYSIEFDSTGRLLDVEVLQKFKKFPDTTRQAIQSYLDQQYDRYRITRSQVQYAQPEGASRAAEVLREALEQRESEALLRFEIEVEGRREGTLVSHELLFDREGAFLRQRIIIHRQLDNLIY